MYYLLQVFIHTIIGYCLYCNIDNIKNLYQTDTSLFGFWLVVVVYCYVHAQKDLKDIIGR